MEENESVLSWLVGSQSKTDDVKIQSHHRPVSYI